MHIGFAIIKIHQSDFVCFT